jgi:hypothetical protein
MGFRVAVLFLLVGSAFAAPESAPPKVEVPTPSIACPSQEFTKFLQTFSDSANVQRRFTRLPLEYGEVDLAFLGTAQEYSRRMIGTFEKIPTFDRQNGGTIFPSKSKRTREHLLIKELNGLREDPEYPEESRSPDDAVVVLFIEDTGFHIYFRFARFEGCWFLHAIHDKST